MSDADPERRRPRLGHRVLLWVWTIAGVVFVGVMIAILTLGR